MPDVILSLTNVKRFEDGDFDLGELGKRLTGVFIDKPQRNEILQLMEGSVGLVIECLDKVNEIISRFWTLSAYRALDHPVRYPQNRFRYPSVLRSGLHDLKTPLRMSTPPSALLGWSGNNNTPQRDIDPERVHKPTAGHGTVSLQRRRS
jgi:hypothetical protein